MTAASMQSTVFNQSGFGVPGELFTNAPWKAESFTLVSALASYNVIGATAYTGTSQGVAEAGSGGDFGFAGILANPKTQALRGDGTNPLNPSLVLPNQSQADLVTMGNLVVTLPDNANIGDSVIFDNTTGALDTIAPGVNLPVGKSFAQAIVDYFLPNAGAPQLAVIYISPTYITPVLA